ncbi:myo-inositol 2-dehydrogenase putative [Fragilariopsis cylindrus CCMP1102]|uniref:Myo-inositol 2-dehydrogenase putative n=1 Tax=Fragilariopsis cylindrus CCMP1102 TaxID=635003 RepID=A0A1E7FI42_9STRA|nr:myo-inositol 2-dehydrogenase putative [Fragilariopsis cylindrus CCMP1102]|eukprot:OEU17705.1 myo-inositol 2-dehydrogenase putative [Fragilariopsis cylindrus CCMP1102]
MNVEVTDGKKLVKVGVIGMGRIGLVHLEAITKAPGVVPIIVSNPTVSKAEAAAAQYNIPKFSDDAMDVITDPEVDAVWICSPSQFHADQIKACAANNKHVFCEKPIATDLAETVEAINACNEAGVKLMIGLQRRFDQNFERVKQAVENNEVGDPIMIKLCSRDPSAPPASYVKGGGGIFTDMAVHDLDMTRFLAGSDPIDILAIGSTHIDMSIKDFEGSEKYDTASCIVRYPNGVQAMIDVCRQSSFGYDQRAEVLGTKGMIQTDNVYPNTAKIYKKDYTGNADMPFDFFLSRYNEAYVTETVAFCNSLVNDTPVPCTGTDGLIALVMAIAADKSAAENRWVKFSEIIKEVYCASPTECELISQDSMFPEGFRPTVNPEDLLVPDVDKQKANPNGSFSDKFKNMFSK